MPEIRLQNLRKDYGAVTVIENLNLEMAEGEFTVLVGPSGCGKSTTLRMIAGLESVTGGEILIGDRDVSRLEPKERDLAMVFQDYALYPHMNVAKNMSFALRLARMNKADIEKRVKDVAATLDLTAYLDRKPAELSGGQRQRVAMGRALVRDAGTFLFDEPLSNLDAKLRGQMRAELALMSQRIKKNMIYVTHDQVEAMTLGDKIVVMKFGEIMQAGTPEELYRSPANKFVAGFIGSPTMNFLDAELREEGGVLSATGDGFSIPLPEARKAQLQAHRDRQVHLGIRPSSFSEGSGGIAMPIILSEYIGAQSVLISEIGRQRVAIEVNTVVPIKSGETREFTVQGDEVHLFDPKTEAAL
ncbi:sn-glycerol-3-phosphate ABC transporter ATP-binding protein UgpC [Marivita sp. S6314]|uniref:ABC transporter ATP-binding protein n=1 Tax=Marivita sp. S6314 TaxID=2926406 RepID=UPI001FF5B1C1|nr:sn-glycerol-3-phosphate ABC transporter ATP-binding protein UgpC [Marivita sp. S6314]MCK0149205.1 sn-glycerol-3-phosphate ABC transporter ATP-binding protein UgpC [Marivita sp. S6314]